MRTVVALYDQIDQARQAVKDLTSAGFTSEDINLISQDASGEYSRYLNEGMTRTTEDVSGGAATGAGVGAVLGGLGGLLLGLGALAIPGIGPVIAAGPIAAALAGAGVGAVAGGLVGALADLGVPEEHAQYYAEGVRRGATLLTVRVRDESAEEVRDILNRYHPIDLDKTVSGWRANNWTGFDEHAEPYDASRAEYNRSSAAMPATGGIKDDASFKDDEFNDRDLNSNRDFDMERMDTESAFHDMDDKDSEFDLERNQDIVRDNIPVTGETPMSVRDSVRGSDMTGMDDEEWTKYDVTCRRDFMDRFVTTGHDYAYYQPAYRFGYTLAGDERYRDADWNTVEPEARREWEMQGDQSAWDDVKDAVRYAWRTVTGRR